MMIYCRLHDNHVDTDHNELCPDCIEDLSEMWDKSEIQSELEEHEIIEKWMADRY